MAYTFINRQKAYLDDDRLWYEIRLSQGKGFLTPEAIVMLIKIGKNFIRTKVFYDPLDKEDAFQTGMIKLLTQWHNFNYKKYPKALPYFTELMKRGMTEGFNQYHNRKTKLNVSINKWHTLGSSW